MTNVFSDVIHEASEKKVSRLAARQLLATRFYLKINRWDVNIVSESSKDLFGIRTLDFRFDVSNGEEPDFLTADITDYIECRPFLASEYDEKPYMPGQRYDDKLDDYCFATPGIYLIPLYLLVGSGSKDDKLRKKRLLAIIKRMRDQITESISTYHFNLDVEAKQEFAFSIIIDSLDRKKYSDASDKDEKFESLIIEKAELWEDYFQKYLYSCIEKMKLNKIEMPEGSRARAIDIYENMNMGGLSLSTLDLVAARVAKVSRESLYDRISKCLINNKKYNEAAFPKEIRRYIPLNYNASTKIKAVDTRASKSCSGLFLEVLGLYYPVNMSKHVRDPKIYKKDGRYYMIQGGRDAESYGCALLFCSDDLEHWKWYDTVRTAKPFGYMWECPDLFEIDGQQIMTCCPQGVDQKGYDYQNVYQCGYFPVEFDLKNKSYSFGKFQEFDKGFDIYATQTFADEAGRRILIGWMGIPDADYDNDATVAYDWIHALTMPRELEWKDGKILQHPLKEMKDLRKNVFTCELEAFTKWAPADCCFELRLDVEEAKNLELKLREDVTISWKDGLFTLSMGESGRGRKQRFAKVEELSDITIFSDTSAIEIFINNGETVLTTRVYSEHLEQKVELVSREVKGSVHGYELGSFEVEYKK